MDSFPRTPFLDSIEKQYRYRYSWTGQVFVIIIGGFMGWFLGRRALSEKSIWWGILALFFLLMFIYGLYILVVTIWGDLKLKFTSDGIYFPNVWRWNSTIYVRYSDFTSVQLFTMQGNAFLQLAVGRKKYPITDSWLPGKGDFQEIVELVQERLPHLFPDESISPVG